jgi:hypothetical protein
MSDEIEMLRTELAHAKEYAINREKRAEKYLAQLRDLQVVAKQALYDEGEICAMRGESPASWWDPLINLLYNQLKEQQ